MELLFMIYLLFVLLAIIYAFKIALVAIIGILIYLIVYALFSFIKSQMPEERKKREELKKSEREMLTAVQESHEFIRKWNEEIAEEKRKSEVATVFEGILYLDSEIEDADRKIRRLVKNDRSEFDVVTNETKYDIVLKDGTLLGTLPKSVLPSLIEWLNEPTFEIRKSILAERDYPSKFQIYLRVRDTTKY